MTSLLVAREIELNARLHPTDLECGEAEMIAVIGPNGAGKTSLLRAIAGIELSGGRVEIGGEAVASAPPARRMRMLSFLPASRSIIWPIAVRDVIALGLPATDEKRVRDLLELLELMPLADRPISQLSTGERTRALLGRALAARPKLLLLDEPLSNLDPFWVLRTLEIMRTETKAQGSATLTSVHDLNLITAFDRVLLLDHGKVVADASPEEILASQALVETFRIERTETGWRIKDEV